MNYLIKFHNEKKKIFYYIVTDYDELFEIPYENIINGEMYISNVYEKKSGYYEFIIKNNNGNDRFIDNNLITVGDTKNDIIKKYKRLVRLEKIKKLKNGII